MDSSGLTGSLALLDESKLLAQTRYDSELSHSEKLLPALQDLLKTTGLSLQDLDLLAVTRGPGLFTGLRVGISSVKALALSLKLPVASVSTLEVLAQPFLVTGKIIGVCIDARRGQVYGAAYQLSQKSTELKTLLAPNCYDPEAWLEKIQELTGEKILLGSGLLCLPKISLFPWPSPIEGEGKATQAAMSAPTDPKFHQIDPVVVGRLGLELARRNQLITGEALQPEYLRLSDAELVFSRTSR